MKTTSFSKLLFLILLSLNLSHDGFGCSGYKITVGNKTIFGSNEDAWRVTPHIWFENGTSAEQYGAAFTGSRQDGANGYAPQAGMNEMGLAFERLAAHHPTDETIDFSGKKNITNPTVYLKDILHNCKTVEEVREYISQYNHSYFIEDVFMYVDRSGNYLIVEPYSMTIGHDPTYVVSNFCPSITSEQDASQLQRYRNGVAFLKGKIDTTLEFCTALSDTMHVCRPKIGDGTLLTSIWDLKDGTIHLYFYHNYDIAVHFNLNEELKKGDHIIAIETLFPLNSEFEKLRQYKTPKNSIAIGLLIVASAGLFLFAAIFFLISFLRRKPNTKYAWAKILLFPLGLILFYYMYVLSGSINVFYFPAPYRDPANIFVTLSSYIPFVLSLAIIPFLIINVKLFKGQTWSLFAKGLFTLFNLVCIVLILLFVYWGFFDVFN